MAPVAGAGSDASSSASSYKHHIGPAHPSAGFAAAKDRASIILHWADADGPARGQLHVAGLAPFPALAGTHSASSAVPLEAGGALAPKTGMPPSAPVADVPLRVNKESSWGTSLHVTMHVAESATHSFSSSPLCHIPVDLVIHNCLSDFALAFTVDTQRALVTASGSQMYPAAQQLHSGGCCWVGPTTHAEQWLLPAATTTLRLVLAVTIGGTYALEGLRFAVCGHSKADGSNTVRLDSEAEACPSLPPHTFRVICQR